MKKESGNLGGGRETVSLCQDEKREETSVCV